MERAVARFVDLIRTKAATSPVANLNTTRSSASATSLKLTISISASPDDTDESYSLDVSADGVATASAKSARGALHALATFSQLIERADPPRAGASSDLVVRGLPWSIEDAPRFSHRGVLVDTARHWLPVETLKDFIDAMAWSKLSVLHWHITDSQAFPFASASLPRLELGAWSPLEVYTPQDVEEIAAFE
jgi:hexosaminidase